MTSVELAREGDEVEAERIALDLIRYEFEVSGGRLGSSVSSGVCAIRGCRTMPFVLLRTSTNQHHVCLRHFEKLELAI